jgi:ribose transport system ATP-binding protein
MNGSMYLRMENITKSFPGVKALNNVSIALREGEVVGLLGENGAGKSTLMNILGGIVQKSEGKIYIADKEVDFRNPIESQKAGIAFIHQELSLFSKLTVAENIFITTFPTRRLNPFINQRVVEAKVTEVLKGLEANIHPNTLIQDLTMGQRQMVEIASAICKEAKIMIFDEPTSSLSDSDRARLIQIINMLKKQGKIILYISHDIEEAIEVCDRVLVLRDAQNSGEIDTSHVPVNEVLQVKDDIIRLLVGMSLENIFEKTYVKKGEVVLSVNNLTRKGYIEDVSFELRKGEILGMYGLIGAGRSETVRAIFGLDPIDGGEVVIKGNRLEKLEPRTLMNAGVGFVTENRREDGLILGMSIKDNITITSIKDIVKGIFGTIQIKKEVEIATRMSSDLKVASPSIYQQVGKLSGGNQQKVVIGKWLQLRPDIFILDEPTKGIDVGAKREIYKLIFGLVESGVSVILISSEIEEIMGMSDRIFVMRSGRITGEFDVADATEDRLLHCAMG